MAPSTAALRKESGSSSLARGRPQITHEIPPSRSKVCVTRKAKKLKKNSVYIVQKAQCYDAIEKPKPQDKQSKHGWKVTAPDTSK